MFVSADDLVLLAANDRDLKNNRNVLQEKITAINLKINSGSTNRKETLENN